MTKLSFVLVLSLAAFGCKKKDDAAAGGGDCGPTVTAAVERVHGSMEKDLAGAGVPADKIAQVAPKMTEVLLKRCTEDKWGDAYLKCVNEGKTAEDMEKCGSKLPKDQAKKIDDDLKTAMEPLLGKMDGSPGSVAKPNSAPDNGSAATPPPAAGSDTGSAAPAAGSDHAEGSAAGSGSAQ